MTSLVFPRLNFLKIKLDWSQSETEKRLFYFCELEEKVNLVISNSNVFIFFSQEIAKKKVITNFGLQIQN